MAYLASLLSYSDYLFSQLAHPFATGAKARLAFRPTSKKKVPIILIIEGQSLSPIGHLAAPNQPARMIHPLAHLQYSK